jgi:hypothetical protein
LAGTLNPGVEALYNLSNNRISLSDNIACIVKDVTVTVGSDGIPLTSTGIALGSTVQKALGSQVLLALNQTSTTVFPTAQPFITFTQNGTTFEINHIAGLPANNQFLLRVVVYAT